MLNVSEQWKGIFRRVGIQVAVGLVQLAILMFVLNGIFYYFFRLRA